MSFRTLLSTILSGFLCTSIAAAQTDIHITGPQSGFPVAIPQLCDSGGAGDVVSKISDVIAKNLALSGVFKVLNQSSFVEEPGKCGGPQAVAFSDWSVIGAEGLVKGEVRSTGLTGGSMEVSLYLLDVQQQRAVIGKRYEAPLEDYERIANRFSNEIVGFFTGQKGVFGTQIAYVSRLGRFKELFMMGSSGTNQRQLTRDKGLVLSPSWAPTGDRVVFTSYKSRKPELYSIAVDTGKITQLTKRNGLEMGAQYAPDGRTIIASATVLGVSNIVMLDLRGRLLQKITTSSSIDVSPSFSPDGRMVSFCSNRSGGPQIYVKPIAGGSARRISFTQSNYCTSPAWSPKGEKIAFVCRDRGNQLFLSDPDGSQAVQLTFGGNNEDPEWSPDGRFLAFSSDFAKGGPKNIAVLPILTGRAQQITFAKSESGMPAWSPRLE